MEKLKKIYGNIHGYLFMILGSASYALSTAIFLAPLSIVAGGISGLSLIINIIIDVIPIGITIILLNIPILLLGLRYHGLKFTVRALITIIMIGVFTDLFASIPPITSDPILASLYGGICQGIGIAFFIKYEFSSGGTELLARVLVRWLKIFKIPALVALLDGIIVVSGAIVTKNPSNMLYALILIFVSAKVTESILTGFDKSKMCLIITDKGKEISDKLMKNSPRGITKLDGIGMYTEKNHDVLLTCVRDRQLIQLKQIVKDIDENAFIIINPSNEIQGKGFHKLGN